MFNFISLKFILTLMVGLLISQSSTAQEDRFWVEAVGMAPMQSAQSLARRHAIAEALLSASLSGGASMQGYSVLDKTRVVADRFMMRPTGTIIRYEMVSEGQSGKYWQVKLRALVGPTVEAYCDESRSLTVAMYPPSVHVSPYAPAWSQQLVANASNALGSAIEKHPRISVDAVSHLPENKVVSAQRAGFDYTSLTRGRVQVSAADHGVQIAGKSEVLKDNNGTKYLQVSFTFTRTQGGSPVASDKISSAIVLKQALISERLNGSKRKQAETQITRDLLLKANKILAGWTCRPPIARLAVRGNDIEVPLGSRHGLSKTSLAFLAEPTSNMDVFEIVSLNSKSAKLRAISPSRDINQFHNKEVRFLRTKF